MAVAKFMSARILATVRNTNGKIWKLGTFGMHVGNNSYGYFMTRSEVARVLKAKKTEGVFHGLSGNGPKDAPYNGRYQFAKLEDGTINFGCQTFSPQAVETLKAWALAGE